MSDPTLAPLDDLAVIEAYGTDVIGFLQGQLSHDLARLASRGSLLAGLHNPQGRVIALPRLLQAGSERVLLVLPVSLLEQVVARLSRYILRARARVTDARSTWRVAGLAGPGAARHAAAWPHMAMDGTGARVLVALPADAPLPTLPRAGEAAWQAADIAAGLPQVWEATSAQFVAQMLNLDLLDAISFDKGCYTGQEVIARAHYRGQVKRRMQRFATPSPMALEPGTRVHLADGRNAQVVSAVAVEDGQQFLAVTTLPAPASAGGAADAAPLLVATQLPLPYALPA